MTEKTNKKQPENILTDDEFASYLINDSFCNFTDDMLKEAKREADEFAKRNGAKPNSMLYMIYIGYVMGFNKGLEIADVLYTTPQEGGAANV